MWGLSDYDIASSERRGEGFFDGELSLDALLPRGFEGGEVGLAGEGLLL